MFPFILQLSDPRADLGNVGGKGMSLAILARAGLPVPNGFHITTGAYRHFVEVNDLQPRILAALAGVDAARPASLEAAAGRIAGVFSEASIPPGIAAAVREAYAPLQATPVAVRSSATAEDLPGASFAGQQETYLNVSGQAALLDAVRRCWASLWTGRAIGYRLSNHIDPGSLALAVVVQELVPAEAAGVMFTANPLNGRRDEIVINAAWGLGESVVSGAVTPDTYILRRPADRLKERRVATKELMTVRAESGTREQRVPAALQKKAVLSRSRAEELARAGERIERLYGLPMDIEWATAHGAFAILQARPVTSLPEPPLDWTCPRPKTLLMRASFAEFVPGAVSPLFATLGVPMAEQAGQALMSEYLGPVGAQNYPFVVVNGYVYIGMGLNASMYLAMVGALLRGSIQKMLKTSQSRWDAMSFKYHALVDRWQAQPLEPLSCAQLLEEARELFGCSVESYSVAQAGMIPAASGSELSFGRYYKALVKRRGDPDTAAFLLGFDSLPLRAEKSLFDLARWAGGQAGLAAFLSGTPTAELCRSLQDPRLPVEAPGSWCEFDQRFSAHLAAYGHTVYDLDFSRPVPGDDPAPLIEALKAYLSGKGSDPYARQQAQIDARQQATDRILKRLDPLRRRWFERSLRWAQSSAPKREDAIAEVGLGYPLLRQVFQALGARLVKAGALREAEQIYWLEARELEALAAAADRDEALDDQGSRIRERQATWQRESAARVPSLLPEGSFYARLEARTHSNEAGVLKGIGASAGRVTAPACVLRSPADFPAMHPGDVIVAVTTTPAWTPLFAIASAVVTEIGGPLSHSSIVAREYGIPAVLAAAEATRRIRSGQVITVDGTQGRVLVDETERPGE